MAIRITCPGCQTALTLDDKMRGKKVRCKACEKVLSIPAAKVKALAHAAESEEEAVQDEPRPKLRNASVPAEYDGDPEDDGAKKKKKKKGKKGAGVFIIAGVAALAVLLIVGGSLWAVITFIKPDKLEKKQEPVVARGPEVKEKDERTPARIVVPGIKEGNPATKKGGTGVISNVRGAAYRAERRSELRQIGLSYVQYADEYKGASRNLKTWLEYIKIYGPIRESVEEGYYRMNFNARMDGSSVIAYERDIDVGQAHLCVKGDGSVDHVPLAELKTILGRDP